MLSTRPKTRSKIYRFHGVKGDTKNGDPSKADYLPRVIEFTDGQCRKMQDAREESMQDLREELTRLREELKRAKVKSLRNEVREKKTAKRTAEDSGRWRKTPVSI